MLVVRIDYALHQWMSDSIAGIEKGKTDFLFIFQDFNGVV
jgi:hypothetical protein